MYHTLYYPIHTYGALQKTLHYICEWFVNTREWITNIREWLTKALAEVCKWK